MTQQIPLNVDFEVELNGKPLGDKTETPLDSFDQ